MEERVYGTGKRKSAIARVYLYPKGEGTIEINNSKFENYFGRKSSRMIVKQPLETVKMTNKVNIYAKVAGGGLAAQADAMKYGIAKCLLALDPAFRKSLKSEGFLTRDSRRVERKKAGQRGARARFQFSKR